MEQTMRTSKNVKRSVAKHLLWAIGWNSSGVLSGDGEIRTVRGVRPVLLSRPITEAETFGLVLVEAMQFGKPVISTHWRGIPSVVADGRSGFLGSHTAASCRG
jgi:hypothetical protein